MFNIDAQDAMNLRSENQMSFLILRILNWYVCRFSSAGSHGTRTERLMYRRRQCISQFTEMRRETM